VEALDREGGSDARVVLLPLGSRGGAALDVARAVGLGILAPVVVL